MILEKRKITILCRPLLPRSRFSLILFVEFDDKFDQQNFEEYNLN